MIGYMTFPIIVGVLNMLEIRKTVDYRQEVFRTFGLTAICAVFMGACTFGAYKLLMTLAESNTVAVIVALLVALVTYFGPMIALKNVERP